MAIGAVVARILTQYSDKGSKAAQKDIAKLGKNMDKFAKNITRAFGVAAAAVGAFAIKVGKDAVQAAIADQKSQVLLANSLRNTTGATNAAITAVENYISKLQLQVGVADDELRPALSKLAAVTGSVTAAQDLLGVALDVSAFSGADLGTAVSAVTRALQGNFRGLQKLVPSLDATTLKSKNFAKIMAEVQKATQGAAASRANTLEYRLEIMRIRFGEVLETLGYALLPVIERFADTLQNKVLPRVEEWVEANKKDLVKGLQAAATFTIKLVEAAVSFSQWVINNTGLIKAFAALIATMWTISKIYTFIVALQGVATAFGLITVGANGATAATLRFKSAIGFLLKGGKLLAGIFAVLALSGDSAKGAGGYPKGTVGEREAKTKAALKKAEKPLGNFQMSTGTVLQSANAATDAGNSLDAILKKLQTAQDKLNNSKKKELTTEQKIINAMLKKYGLTLMTSEIEAKATATAIEANLKKQGKLGLSSPTISLLASANTADQGTLGTGSAAPVVNVNITTPYGTKDDFVVDVDNSLKTLRRRSGMTPSGRMTGLVAE